MTGVSRNTNREFTGCDILSPLEKLCPQSLGRSLRCGYRVSEQMRYFFCIVFRVSQVNTGPLLESNDLPRLNATLLKLLNFAVHHNLTGFFNEIGVSPQCGFRPVESLSVHIS
ncbi:hypothetical protein Tco_1328601 [Tanacetum coccineum]